MQCIGHLTKLSDRMAMHLMSLPIISALTYNLHCNYIEYLARLHYKNLELLLCCNWLG